MNLKKQIKSELKTAMIKKDEVAKNVFKGLLSAFTNELVASGKTPRDVLSENEILKIIKKSIKQRKDSMEQFIQGGRNDLAINEKKELVILEKYLPKMMSELEILKIATKEKEVLQITDQSKIGILVGAVMKETSGQADGYLVKKIVSSLFN